MDTPQSDPVPTTEASADSRAEHIKLLLTQVLGQADELQGVVIAYVKRDGNAVVRWSTPIQPAMLSHVSRMLDVRVDALYRNVMGIDRLAVPVAPPAMPAPPTRNQRRVAKKRKGR